MSTVEKGDTCGLYGHLTIKTFKDGVLLREIGPIKNKVVSSEGYGRNLVLRQMAGDAALPIEIDSASIGDGTTPPANSDTDLENPLETAIPLTTISVTNNVLSIDVFMPSGDLPDDTYSEFGFKAGTRLMSRILITPTYTKASGEDTLFSYQLTMTG